MATSSAKFANALSTTQATIVLIDFARSWSVDGVHLVLLALMVTQNKKALPKRKDFLFVIRYMMEPLDWVYSIFFWVG
jgi:hypothetical protein